MILLSVIRIKMEKYGDAMKLRQKANAASPDNPEVQYQIGSIYYRENDSRYIAAYDRLFSLAGGKKKYPSRYKKVFILLAKHYQESGSYGRTLAILKTLDDRSQTFETHLLAAKAYYGLKEYDNAIDRFEKLSLNGDDKLMLCRAYVHTDRRQKAKSLLAELSVSGDYLSRAKRDPVLSGLARELESESAPKRQEPEKKEPEIKKEPAPKEKQPVRKSASDDEDEDEDDDR